MLEEIKQLESANEDYEVRINDLEKFLLANNSISDNVRGTVIEQLSHLKQSQGARKSTIGGSVLYSKLIKDIKAKKKSSGFELRDMQGSFAFNMSPAADENFDNENCREYGTTTSDENFKALDPRQSVI